ncbi:MAG: acyltransferase [Xanthobacteraceae bacterium]
MDQPTRYQPEIDGLRALAITPVVLFHAGVPGLRGGYVGVDVFFVLSGFLISRLLLAELGQTGTIDFAGFYARRIRRLLPALALVVTAVLLVGAFILSPALERPDLSRSAAATMAFVSNIYFWRMQANYFAQPTDWIVLLNTWTLSVEEQFYLVWPVLLALAASGCRVRAAPANEADGRHRETLLFLVSLALAAPCFQPDSRARQWKPRPRSRRCLWRARPRRGYIHLR